MSDLFSNLGIDGKLLFAQAANFLLVLWVLNRFVFKKMLRFLETRKEGIEKGVELTKKAEHEMERIGEVRKLAMGKARELAEGLVVQAKAHGAVAEKEILERAKDGAKAILERAQKESERKKQDALKEVQEEMQKRAFFLAEKVLLRSLTKEDERRIGQDLIKEIEQHGKES